MSDEFRSVDTPHYHVWTDALHARELARKTKDRWNRGSYVRWTIVSACTALEISCAGYLGRSVGWRFKDDVNAACDVLSIPRPDWGQGLWQRVLEVRDWRNDCVHAALPPSRLFAPVAEAEDAISVIRAAVVDMATRTGSPSPTWVNDDIDNAEGLTMGASFRSIGHALLSHQGASADDPNTIRICYVYEGKEWDSEHLPPDPHFDPQPALEKQIKAMRVPISAVKAYRGPTLLKEIALNMRGS